MPFRQLKSFFKILIGVQYENSQRARCHVKEPAFFPCAFHQTTNRSLKHFGALPAVRPGGT